MGSLARALLAGVLRVNPARKGCVKPPRVLLALHPDTALCSAPGVPKEGQQLNGSAAAHTEVKGKEGSLEASPCVAPWSPRQVFSLCFRAGCSP